MELNGDLEHTRSAFSAEKEKEAAEEQGVDAILLLQWPDNTVKTHTFKLGATVAYVKMFLEQTYAVPMGRITLKVGDKTLMDPLSLSDCAGIKAGQTVVKVTVKDA